LAKDQELTYELEDVYGLDIKNVYGLDVRSAKEVRAVVRIETNQGVFALKKVSHKPDKLQFMYEAQEHLWNNGFQNLPRFVKTLDGRPFVDVGDGLVFLNNWIDGQESNVRDHDQLMAIARLQARFHAASNGFEPTVDARIKTRWDEWIERFTEQRDDIKNVYAQLKGKAPQNELEAVFLETCEPMLELAEEALKRLQASPYQQVLKQAQELKGFAHGDFTYHNFIQSPDGSMQVIDFDYCAHELRLHDFARFLRKMMRRTKWDIEVNNAILKAYHEINPLSVEELQVLHATMFLPQRYWRSVERGFLSNRYTPEGSIKKMRVEFAQLEDWKRYLAAFPTRL
jgi:CotS family spore coat protein